EHGRARAVVSRRMCSPSCKRGEECERPRFPARACFVEGQPVLRFAGGIVALCPGSHPEQVVGQSHKFLVWQTLCGVELTIRGVDCCPCVALGERRGGQHAQQTSLDARVTLEAESCRGPRSEERHV